MLDNTVRGQQSSTKRADNRGKIPQIRFVDFSRFIPQNLWVACRLSNRICRQLAGYSTSGLSVADRYPDSMLDFNFVAGTAKDWNAEGDLMVWVDYIGVSH